MLMLVRLPQRDVISAAATSPGLEEGLVGPTSSTGWTAMLCPDFADCDSAFDHQSRLLLGENDEGETVLVAFPGDVSLTWPAAEHIGPPAGDLDGVSDLLVEWFGTASTDRERLRAGLANPSRLADDSADPIIDQVVQLLSEAVDLPNIEPATPATAIVVFRGDMTAVRVIGSMLGPIDLRVDPTGWSVLSMPADEATEADPAAAGQLDVLSEALATATSRRSTTILLWRSGPMSGLMLSHRRRNVRWTWNSEWHDLAADTLADEAGNIEWITRALGQPRDPTALRALLRRRAQLDDPLAAFADLTGLPAALIARLDGALPPDELGEIERLDDVTVGGAFRLAAAGVLSTPPTAGSLSTKFFIAGEEIYGFGLLAIAVLRLSWLMAQPEPTGWFQWLSTGCAALVGTAMLAVARRHRRGHSGVQMTKPLQHKLSVAYTVAVILLAFVLLVLVVTGAVGLFSPRGGELEIDRMWFTGGALLLLAVIAPAALQRLRRAWRHGRAPQA